MALWIVSRVGGTTIRECGVEIVSLVILVVLACSLIPGYFPTLPYLSVVSYSSLKAASESVNSGELPEWDPYLGGGRPLAPASYYLLYGFGKVGLLVLTSALSMVALLANVSRLMRVIVMLGSVVVGLLVPSPFPVLVALYVLGLAGDCQLCRAVGAVGIPDVALCLELGRDNPSVAVLTVSIACLADVVIAVLGASSLVFPSKIILFIMSLIMAFLVLVALGILMIMRNAGLKSVGWRWKRVGVSMVILSIIQICLYTIPTALAVPLILFFALVIAYVDRVFVSKFENVEGITALISVIMLSSFVFLIYTISSPKFTVVGEISLGSGMKYVVSPDPRFTECVKSIFKGEPVWDAPLFLDPHWAPAALLGSRLGDPRVISPPFPTRSLRILPSVKVVLVASPSNYAELSSNYLELVRCLSSAIGSVEPPDLKTPRRIRGHGPVGQVYDRWWWRAADDGGLLSVKGEATYSRPSAPLSVILTFLGLGLALRRVGKTPWGAG